MISFLTYKEQQKVYTLEILAELKLSLSCMRNIVPKHVYNRTNRHKFTNKKYQTYHSEG
jgi:hypothetical protein